MQLTKHLAKHVMEVHFGGNWTTVNLRDNLSDVTWQQAVAKVDGFNTIAALAYHINYYISAVSQVLRGGTLDAKDAYSFTHPPVNTQHDWESLLGKMWADAEAFAQLITQLPEDSLWDDFIDKKYGNYYRNIQGIIEHTHYHLGQIVIIKKLLAGH